jgi:CRP/FNR family cyclic AMP-dependent transcriptional regulator
VRTDDSQVIQDVFARVTFLQVMSPHTAQALLAHGRRHAFGVGGALVRQGEVSDHLYIILAGRVRVERSHEQFRLPVVLAELGPGATVGEMGLLDGAPQPITALAVVDVETFALSAAALAEALRDLPDGRAKWWRQLFTWHSSLQYVQDHARDAQG